MVVNTNATGCLLVAVCAAFGTQEIAEREAEAALYSAKLYETERQMSDWCEPVSFVHVMDESKLADDLPGCSSGMRLKLATRMCLACKSSCSRYT